MLEVSIKAEEKKGYVSINGAEEVVCPIVKDREHKYSLNIKKLGFARSFITIGDLEDKELTFDEAALSTARTTSVGGVKKVKQLNMPNELAEKYLSEDEIDTLSDLISKINEGITADAEAAAAAKAAAKKAPKEKKAPLTDLEKLERQIAKLMAKKAQVMADAAEATEDDVVED